MKLQWRQPNKVFVLVTTACLFCITVLVRTHGNLMLSLSFSMDTLDGVFGTESLGYGSPGATSRLPPQGGPYHSWGPEGIDLQRILRYINFTYNNPWAGGNRYWYRPFPAFISIANNTPTMWISVRSISTRRAGAGMRMQIMMQHFQKAISHTLFQYREHFQALVEVLTTTGSIPLVFDLSDYHSCPDPNYTAAIQEHDYYEFAPNATLVPLFTLSRSPTCNYAFPVPTYKTYEYTMLGGSPSLWQEKMNAWEEQYPWHNKTAQLYWRGGCKFYRKALIKKVFRTRFQDVLDIRALGFCGKDVYDLVVQERAPQEESMQYKAVVDIDGTSWSERFPRLLCYNSAVVVLSVPEDYEEYFTVDLVPGVHFIPASLENFTYVANMIMKPENDGMLREIVANANKWCRERMTEDRLNLDFLSVLNGYVEMMNVHDSDWAEKWTSVASAYANGTEASTAGPNMLMPNSIQFPDIPSWDLSTYSSL